jgi:hypothetical protein
MDLDAALHPVLHPATPHVATPHADAPTAYEDAGAWWTAHVLRSRNRDPIDAAIAGGAAADRVSWAFASGYAAALRALLPSLGEKRACVAATEDRGAHPRAIQTTLEGRRVRGSKRWVTLGKHAEVFLVVAKAGEEDGRPRLRVVLVDAKSHGITIVSSTPAPFVPEIEHAQIEFDTEGEPLEGDGYDVFLKPFRTIEDVHVHTAVLAYLGAIGMRRNWPKPIVARLCSLIVCGRSIAVANPRSAETHIALGGMIAETETLLSSIDPMMDERWARDKALLGVAGKARAERFARAFERLSSSGR